MSALIAGGITAGAALVIAFLGLIFSIHYRLGKLASADEFLQKGNLDTQELVRLEVRQLRSENEQTREQMRLDSQESREQMRLLEDRLREQMRLDSQESKEQMRLLEDRIREDMRFQEERTRELIRSESEATRAEIRRLADALVSHHHEADGSVVFRIPPPQDVGD